jgi:hypothetical protein
MKTPKEYVKNLKNKTITQNMLCDCLFSVNKRAKNCRDKIREYKSYNYNYSYHKWDYIDDYESKRDTYYDMKNQFLSILTPICIHELKHYDWYTDNICSIEYFLFYTIGEYSFHSPIQKDDLVKYKLDIIEIDNLNTHGKDINDLLSNQFVQKVLNLIKSGDYVLEL